MRPEVALVDIDLGADSGFDLARRLADDVDGNSPRVILVSTHDEREFVKLIESSPAVGFLAKTELSAERIYRAARPSRRLTSRPFPTRRCQSPAIRLDRDRGATAAGR